VISPFQGCWLVADVDRAKVIARCASKADAFETARDQGYRPLTIY
jgi:hypothetical protein